ncbi:hypothetical protein HZA57_05060, partial [Candidatus Poribacteria bacterium]|nr:hypothetical protein [Candidatus Poribacteria bacterium]
MFKGLMRVLFGDKQGRDMKRLMPLVSEINEIVAEYEKLSDDELKDKSSQFRRMLRVVPRITRVGSTAIYHEHAEQFLRRHPDVAQAVFLGTRRDFHPAELVAFVVTRDGAKITADLATQVREGMARLSPDHKPAHVLFLDEFPIVRGGKAVDYNLLMRAIEDCEFDPWEQRTWAELKSMVKDEREEPEATLDDLLPDAFAAIKEACRRHCGKKWMAAGAEIEWNMVPFDVQLAGGVALHQGNIAEMATGEGKTLVAIFPLYLNGLSGRGSHLVTVNDYLSRRDS